MKKPLLFILLAGIAAVTIVAACKKTSNNGLATASLNMLMSGLKPAPQKFSVIAGRDTIVYGTNGTILHFYANSFKDISNNIITSGAVYLELTEIYKTADFIENRTSTLAGSQLLTSRGEINLEATMSGVPVYANKYGVGFIQSSSSSDTMRLYYGSTNVPDSTIGWVSTANVFGVTFATRDDTAYNLGYQAPFYFFDSCTGFNWVNCDQVVSNNVALLTDVAVIVPNANFNGSNTQVFLVFPDKKMNVPVTFYSDNNNSFSLERDGTQIPVGLNYQLVAMTNNNGSWYYYEESGVTSSGMIVHADLSPESEGDIIARLAGLH